MYALINADGTLAQVVSSLDGIDLTGLTVLENAPEPPHEYEWDAAIQRFTPGPAIRMYQRKLDEAIDEIRGRYPAPGLYMSEEYRITAVEARAYQQAGYTGTVPPTVEAWALAANMTAQEAADDILATEQAYLQLLIQTRTARLLGKVQIATATSPAQARAIYDAVLADIESRLPPTT